ncbi:MAG: hypothetical protein Q4D19_04235 [Lautropia sp.]|nr:hypothetical protein [Lautropia sp.]
MQFILMVVEAFFPELLKALSGPDSAPARKRLMKAGAFLCAFCAAWLLVAVILRVLPPDGVGLNEFLSFYEIVALSVFGCSGCVLVLLAVSESVEKRPRRQDTQG